MIVTAEVSEPGFDSLRQDARCEVRQQSLIGEYFVDCESGRSPELLPDGGRIGVRQTASTIPPDLINTIQRRPYRERFRLIISELGAGLAGRPGDLNEVIRRAHPALRELTETIGVLRSQNRTISAFIKDSDTVSEAVHPVREQVARWADESSEFASIQASRSEELGRYWEKLPGVPRRAAPDDGRAGATADAQIPTLRKLGGAAPELTAFLGQVEPFAAATRRSIDDLGDSAAAGNKAVRKSREEIRELQTLAAYAPRLAKPLRQFLETADDRNRSTENDPQAGKGGVSPPAPDKNVYMKGQGFTGLEGLLNYIYYQTLGINAFDEFGHLLRIGIFTLGDCSPYSAKPTPALMKKCGSFTGPYQPGVTDPDPTRNGVAAAEQAERAAPAPTKAERTARGPGRARGAAGRRAARPLEAADPAPERAAGPDRAAPRPAADRASRAARRRPPTSSTTSWRHETRTRIHRRQPRPRRVGHRARRDRRGVPRVQREQRPAVRAYLRRACRAPRRVEPGAGQRGPDRRVPGRRRRCDPARASRGLGRARRAGRTATRVRSPSSTSSSTRRSSRSRPTRA